MMTKHEEELVMNLKDLGCTGYADKLSDVFSTSHVTEKELLGILTDKASEEVVEVKQRKAEMRLRQSGLINTYANLDILEYTPDRQIDKVLIDRLSTCDYINQSANVIITGASGTGKTFIAKALGVKACEENIRVKVCNSRMLIRELSALNKNEEDDTLYKKKLRFYSRIPLLILDEWLAEPVSRTDTVIIQELVDNRWNRTSTIFCSQLAEENWLSGFKNVALGEAIISRIKSHSYSIKLDGEDLRTKHYERP